LRIGKHDADEFMAKMVDKRLVEHLGRSGFVVMKSRHPRSKRASWGRGYEKG
jgi:hypothetical protein